MNTSEDKLNSICRKLYLEGLTGHDPNGGFGNGAVEQAKQALLKWRDDYVDELIGEDEGPYDDDEGLEWRAPLCRDELRAELRAKHKENQS